MGAQDATEGFSWMGETRDDPPTSVSLSHIIPGDNDRTRFDPESIRLLAESISANGLISPIIVRPVWFNPQTGTRQADKPVNIYTLETWDFRYEIVAGERRYRACLLLGKKWIQAYVRNLSDADAMAIMLLENTARQDLNPIDLARAFHVRISRLGWSIEDLARTAGVSVWTVERRLALLQLHPDIAHLVASGHFPTGHAETVSRLDHYRQLIALRAYMSVESMPHARFRRIVSELAAQQQQDSLIDLEAYIQAVQTQEGELAAIAKAYRDSVPVAALPEPEHKRGDTASRFLFRYIQDLLAKGHTTEAASIGKAYLAMIDTHLMGEPN